MTPNDLKRLVWTRLASLVAGYTVTGDTPTAMEVFSPAMQATSGAQPFRSLHHFAGEVSRAVSDNRERGVAMTTIRQEPAMLLAWEGSRPQGANGAYADTILHDAQVVRRVHWRVYVASFDARGDAWAMDTTLAGIQAVESALSERRLPGLFDDGTVHWEESAPWITARRGSYVSVVRFSALLALDTSDNQEALEPEPEPLEQMTGENGPEGFADVEPPLAPSTIDFTDDP